MLVGLRARDWMSEDTIYRHAILDDPPPDTTWIQPVGWTIAFTRRETSGIHKRGWGEGRYEGRGGCVEGGVYGGCLRGAIERGV